MLYGFKLDQIDEAVADRELGLEVQRSKLAEMATTDAKSIRDLHNQVQRLAELEGELQVFQYLQLMVNHGVATPVQMYGRLMESVMTGADDGWSGYANDLKRVSYKAKLEIIRDLKYLLRED